MWAGSSLIRLMTTHFIFQYQLVSLRARCKVAWHSIITVITRSGSAIVQVGVGILTLSRRFFESPVVPCIMGAAAGLGEVLC
jgi:hypothetical protein